MRLLVTQIALKNGYRKLPSLLVVCLVIAMSLWSSDSMETVLKNLVNGLSRQWTCTGAVLESSEQFIKQAKPGARVGCRVVSQLFERIVKPARHL